MLPQPIVDELLAIVREALHNVVKHSGVTSATVTLAQTPTALVLTISDGGKGFSSPIPFASGASTHYGLQGMRERVTVLGGALAIESAPGAGTVVSVQIARTNN
jgi:signal transduction histidine kinase